MRLSKDVSATTLTRDCELEGGRQEGIPVPGIPLYGLSAKSAAVTVDGKPAVLVLCTRELELLEPVPWVDLTQVKSRHNNTRQIDGLPETGWTGVQLRTSQARWQALVSETRVEGSLGIACARSAHRKCCASKSTE